MQYQHIRVSTILKRITFKDTLFKGNYTIDPYQNCSFGCPYCDSSYEQTIFIKTNAVQRLKEELQDISNGRIIIGSVHDPYQPIEQTMQITREILTLLKHHDVPIHILTKSLLVTRDLDILTAMNDVLITISIPLHDPHLASIFEPHVPSPQDRYHLIAQLRSQGITTGIAIIPIIPYLTERHLNDLLIAAKTHHASYVLYKQLELKGDQKHIMFNIINHLDPSLTPAYEALYQESFKPPSAYTMQITNQIQQICKNLQLPTSISIP